jgi:chaperonin GroEL
MLAASVILPGGGAALLYATKALHGLIGDNEDQNAGIAIVRKAIQAPVRQIAENSGVEASIVVGKLLGQKSNTYGFDAQNEQYVDLVETGTHQNVVALCEACLRAIL